MEKSSIQIHGYFGQKKFPSVVLSGLSGPA